MKASPIACLRYRQGVELIAYSLSRRLTSSSRANQPKRPGFLPDWFQPMGNLTYLMERTSGRGGCYADRVVGLVVGFTIQKSKLDMPVRRAYRSSLLHFPQTASNESHSQPPRSLRLFVIYPTDKMLGSMPECKMETQSTSQIACVDTLDGGVLVEFEDGKCALYSASLLRAVLPQAVEFEVSDDVEEPTTQSSDIVQKWAIHGRHRRQLNSSYL